MESTLRDRKLGRRVSLLQGNILDGLSLRSSSLHHITCFNIIQEVSTKALPELLREMERILFPGVGIKAVIPFMMKLMCLQEPSSDWPGSKVPLIFNM